jgi:hypothetical protein
MSSAYSGNAANPAHNAWRSTANAGGSSDSEDAREHK